MRIPVQSVSRSLNEYNVSGLSPLPIGTQQYAGVTLKYCYLIKNLEEPTERYEEVTFTLTIPASLEHVRDYVTSAYEGENAPMKVTDATYTASFTVKFNWE